MFRVAVDIARKRVMHRLETESSTLTQSFPDMLFTCEMIRKPSAHQCHSAERCWVGQSDMTQNLDYDLRWNMRNGAWGTGIAFEYGVRRGNRRTRK